MRSIIIRFVIYGGLFILSLGLFHSQVLEGGRYRTLSEQNRIRLIPIEAPRGRVFDRDGRLLATNRPSYDLIATPEDVDAGVFPVLAKLLNIPEKELRKRMSAPREYPFAPAIIEEDISRELVFKVEERRAELPGVDIRVAFLRYYPYEETASHLIGYIGKINPEEYRKFDDRERFGMNSMVGRAGIEKIYDYDLRGVRGGRQIEVNARGQLVRVLSQRDPEPGKDLTLTVDLDLQSKVMALIKGKHAAIALMDLKTQGMLVMASAPGFNPNAFVMPGKGAERMGFLRAADSPLLDRGVGSAYPPGSVFKLVTALAGLETGKITPHTRFTCNGGFRLNGKGRRFKCWYTKGHGNLNLYQALERSCNVYFYNVGSRLSPDDIAKYARIFGLGEPLPIEVTGMDSGLVPDSSWKQKKFREKWYQGETLSFAIGQSYLLVSPLQMLRLVAIIAEEGQVMEPHILKNYERVNDPSAQVSIKKEHLQAIQRAMLQVVQSDYGTGQLARVDFLKLAAKTGTAQAPPKEAHSWMAGFFPFDKPEIAFVVFVEHGGSGGITSGRLMKSLLEQWKGPSAAKVA